MLKKLAVSNFRQHEERVWEFTPGLNVIRGRNESGKSTMQEAIGYAFLGTSFLREPVADTVTWGVAANKLKVQLEFDHSGIEYTLRRGTSGAELQFGSELVTGQREVTRYVEKLFGAESATLTKVHFSKQGKLQGALADGDAATINLIESLSDMDVLDRLVERIQQHRPCGSTAAIQGRIQALSVPVPIPDAPSPAAVDLARESVAQAARALDLLPPAPAQIDVEQAQNLIAQAQVQVLLEKQRLEQLSRLKIETPVEPALDRQQVAELKAKRDHAIQNSNLMTEYLRKVPKSQYTWEGSRETFAKEYEEAREAIAVLRAGVFNTEKERDNAQRNYIDQEFCALCKKDLRDVPEVAAINAAIKEKIAPIELTLSSLNEQLLNAGVQKAAMDELLSTDSKIAELFSLTYWDHDVSVMPRQVLWRGKNPVDVKDAPTLAEVLAAEGAWVNYDRALQLCQNALAAKARLEQPLPQINVTAANQLLKEVQEYAARKTILMQNAHTAEKALLDAQHTYAQAAQAVEEAERLAALQVAQLEGARQEMATVEFWNALIKKIRNARPIVANKLWNLVLAAVSHYATQIRQVASVATKEGDKFLVNGKSVAGLAGSALDSLGLAIRVALGKTFVPSVDFMLLDEVAAACDENRETAMLGMLATVGVPQVLLVTHSNLADSLADNFIQL